MKSWLIDKPTAELLGHIALHERMIADLARRLEEVERRLARSVAPSQLISEGQAAELLGLSTRTLARWRKSSPPPIPVLERAGVIRYRVEDIERFIREGTRGARKAQTI